MMCRSVSNPRCAAAAAAAADATNATTATVAIATATDAAGDGKCESTVILIERVQT